MSDATRLLQNIGHGNPAAAEELLPLVYEELRRLAAARMAAESPGLISIFALFDEAQRDSRTF
ncbi:MAG TPA: ECF-type sigma factor [Candidatus Cybelea sp.]|jgi:hypothetical protein|nr:ECF-type sigma factor [Candidatus Cybelea sp.]